MVVIIEMGMAIGVDDNGGIDIGGVGGDNGSAVVGC